jgi:putative acetyltransferase
MIRPYQPDDVEPVLDVWFAAASLAHPFLTPAFMADERETIRSVYMPITQTWVYEQEGRIIGFISLLGNEVGAIFVDPAFQGRGGGRALMDQARGLHPVLELEVFAANRLGRAFYERYGFTYLSQHIHEPTGHMLLRLRYHP